MGCNSWAPGALYWDTQDPYHYVRLANGAGDGGSAEADFDLLIVGGEDHKTGQAEDTGERHAHLLEWARRRFPIVEPPELAWSGQVMETVGGLAFIGRNPLARKTSSW